MRDHLVSDECLGSILVSTRRNGLACFLKGGWDAGFCFNWWTRNTLVLESQSQLGSCCRSTSLPKIRYFNFNRWFSPMWGCRFFMRIFVLNLFTLVRQMIAIMSSYGSALFRKGKLGLILAMNRKESADG